MVSELTHSGYKKLNQQPRSFLYLVYLYFGIGAIHVLHRSLRETRDLWENQDSIGSILPSLFMYHSTVCFWRLVERQPVGS